MTSTTTSNYLPVLIAATSSYPLNSNTTSTSLPSSPTIISSALPQSEDLRPHHSHHPPAHDDTSVSLMPRSQVDYLSHNWEEEDVWRSWRNMTRQKNEIANGIRLENASWRTWWKQRNGLGTVTPETLNWLKDSDVTWLYGPLHTAGDQYPAKPPPSTSIHPPDRSSSSTGSIASTVSPPVNSVAPTKPILKHRSISQQLTSDLPPTFPTLNTSVPAYTPSSSSDSESELLSPMDTTPGPRLPSAGSVGRRPSLQHTKSESYITKWGPDRRFRKESPPRIEPPHPSTEGSSRQVTHDSISHISESTETTTTTAESSPTDPGIVSSTNSSDSNGQITQSDTPRLSNKRHHHNHYGKERDRKKKKHISFNTFVEQCIAIETPQPSPSSLEGLPEEVEDMDVDIGLDQGDRQVLSRSLGNTNGRVVRIEYRDDDDDDDDEDSQDDDMDGLDEDSALRFRMAGRGRYAMGRNPWGAAYDDGYDEDEEEGDDYEDDELGEDFSWGGQHHQNPPTAPHQHITPANSGPTLNASDPDENRPDHRASTKLPSARSHSMVSTASSSSTASSTTSASTASTTSTTSSNSEYASQPSKNRPTSNRRLSNSTTSTYRPGDNYSVYAPDLTGSRGTNSSSDSGRTSRGSRRGRNGSGSGSGSNNSRQMVGVAGWKVPIPPNSVRSPSITIAPIAPTILKTGGTDAAPGGSGDLGDYFGHHDREWAEGFGDEGSDGEYRPWIPKEDLTRSGNTSEDNTSSTPVELVYVPPPSWGAVNAQRVRRNNSREILENHEDGFGNAVEYDATPRGPGVRKGRKIFSVGEGDSVDGEVEMVEDTLLPESRSYTVPSVVVRRTASLGDVAAASSSTGTDPRLRRSESYSNSFGGRSGIGSGQGEERRSRSRSRSRTPSPNLISSIQPELSTSPSKGGLLSPPVASSVPRSSSYSGSFPSSGRESSTSSTRGRSTETRGRSNSRHLQSSSSWSSERDRGRSGHTSSSVGSSLSPDATGSLPTSGIASAGAYSGGRGRERGREGDRDKRSTGGSWSYSPGSSNVSPSGGGERERGRDRTGTKRLKHSLSPEDISTREQEKERMGRSINAVLPPPQSISPSSSATSESSRGDDRATSPAGSSVTSGSASGSTVQDGSSSQGPVPQRPPIQSSESSSSSSTVSSSATVTLGFYTPVSSPTLPEAKNAPSLSYASTPATAPTPAAPVPIPVHQMQAVDQLSESVVSSSITSSTDSNYMQDAEKQRSQMPTPSNSPIVLTKMPRIVSHTTPPSPAKRGSEPSPARAHTRTGSAHRPPLSVPAPHVAAPVESPTTSAINVNTAIKSSSPSAAEAKAKSLKTKSPPISPSNSNSTSTSTSTIKPPSSSPTVENIGTSNAKPATPPSIVITSRRSTSPPGSPTHDGLVGKAVEMVSHAGKFFGLWSKDQLDQRQVLAAEHRNDA